MNNMIQQIEKQVTISDDGIAIFDGFIPPQLCDEYIKYFDAREKGGFTHDRWTSQGFKPTVMEDTQLYMSNGDFLADVDAHTCSEQFLEVFWKALYPEYIKKFSVITDFAKHKIYNLKIQKTNPSQGYHVWHCENAQREYASRFLVLIMYLNDVEEGGETEFLYMKRRVQAKKGRVALWPAGFPHTHRGNPPLSGTKYILTGWVEF